MKGNDNMLHFEMGADVILDPALNAYEEHFGDTFPFYEYIDLTRNDKYDVSVEGSKRLAELIETHINQNQPVIKPDGYDDRVY